LKQVWQWLWWLVGKLLFLATLMVGILMIVMMPLLLTSGKPLGIQTLTTLANSPWWREVSFHLKHLAHGQLFPPNPPFAQRVLWQTVPRDLSTGLAITLKLVGVAFVESIVLGLSGGWLMSRLAPNRLRQPAWAISTVLQCLPDLLVACGFDLALIMLGWALGKSWVAPEMKVYQQLFAPTLAMTVLAAPYIARVTANAIDEVRGELFIRTALAKGLPTWRVVFKHIGKSVLLRTWTILPVVTSILLSAAAPVEYIMEIHGIGRALILSLGPLAGQWYPDRYVAVVFLFPLLAVFTVVSAVSQAGYRLLDPRPQVMAQPSGRPLTRMRWQRPRMPRISFPSLSTVWLGLRDALAAVPARLRAAGQALKNPSILIGTLLLLGLLVVAIGAPLIAPYNPNKQFKLFVDAGRIWAPPSDPGHRRARARYVQPADLRNALRPDVRRVGSARQVFACAAARCAGGVAGRHLEPADRLVRHLLYGNAAGGRAACDDPAL
jgi:oligopeptide transport system permease protein